MLYGEKWAEYPMSGYCDRWTAKDQSLWAVVGETKRNLETGPPYLAALRGVVAVRGVDQATKLSGMPVTFVGRQNGRGLGKTTIRLKKCRV